MAEQLRIKLNDGTLMPQLGLGVWQASVEEARSAAIKALKTSATEPTHSIALYQLRSGCAMMLHPI